MTDHNVYIAETDSTSSEMHRMMQQFDLPHGYCIITDFQTTGYGQATNRWESERGKNLLFSLLLHPDAVSPAEQFIITEIVTLAIADALQPEIDEEITIKWPNDIYIGDRKLCGILIENTIYGNSLASCIAGIGININQTVFISDAPNPVSMKQISHRDHNRLALLKDIIANILTGYADLAADNSAEHRTQLHTRYLARLYRREGLHAYRTPGGERFYASIYDITPQGFLVLRTADGRLQQYAYKEVICVHD